MSKVILHIDLNAFFVRCEELVNPSLEGKPVIIGHNGRGGIVSTCSYEARKYGVKSGMPTYKALLLCKNAILLPGNFELYHSKSQEFFRFVKKYSQLVEPASIDECYIDITERIRNEKKPLSFLKNLQDELYKATGLKCSIGVAPTKFLAKMASDLKKPLGLVVINRKNIRQIIDPLPIEDFFGIGKKTAPRLKELGVNTIGDLYVKIQNEDETIKKELGKFYYTIKDWINGYGSDIIDVTPFDPKSIGHSTTLSSDETEIVELKKPLRKMVEQVHYDAVKANKVGNSVQIVLKDNEFKVLNRSKKLNKFTNDLDVILKTAEQILEKNYDGRPIRLIGVTLQNLKDQSEVIEELSIFDNYEDSKQDDVRKIISDLNKLMDKPVFKTAADKMLEDKK